MSDLDLLHAYAVHNAEPAFAQLVERPVDLFLEGPAPGIDFLVDDVVIQDRK